MKWPILIVFLLLGKSPVMSKPSAQSFLQCKLENVAIDELSIGGAVDRLKEMIVGKGGEDINFEVRVPKDDQNLRIRLNVKSVTAGELAGWIGSLSTSRFFVSDDAFIWEYVSTPSRDPVRIYYLNDAFRERVKSFLRGSEIDLEALQLWFSLVVPGVRIISYDLDKMTLKASGSKLGLNYVESVIVASALVAELPAIAVEVPSNGGEKVSGGED